MRICFPTQFENKLDSKVFGHFGSAPYFAIFDTDSHSFDIINNNNAHHEHGKCNPVGQLISAKVDAVVVAGIGANAMSKLNYMGIKVYKLKDSIRLVDIPAKFMSLINHELTTDDCCNHNHSDESSILLLKNESKGMLPK